MKLVQLTKQIWINIDTITFYDEQSEYLHFTDGERMKVDKDLFKVLIAGVKASEKRKAAQKAAEKSAGI